MGFCISQKSLAGWFDISDIFVFLVQFPQLYKIDYFAVMVITEYAFVKMVRGTMIKPSFLITLEYPRPVKSCLHGAVCQSMLGSLSFRKPSHGDG